MHRHEETAMRCAATETPLHLQRQPEPLRVLAPKVHEFGGPLDHVRVAQFRLHTAGVEQLLDLVFPVERARQVILSVRSLACRRYESVVFEQVLAEVVRLAELLMGDLQGVVSPLLSIAWQEKNDRLRSARAARNTV